MTNDDIDPATEMAGELFAPFNSTAIKYGLDGDPEALDDMTVEALGLLVAYVAVQRIGGDFSELDQDKLADFVDTYIEGVEIHARRSASDLITFGAARQQVDELFARIAKGREGNV